MKKVITISLVFITLYCFLEEVFAQDRQFRVLCGAPGVSDDRQPPGTYLFDVQWYYRHVSIDTKVPIERDFSIGVLIPLYIQNCSQDEIALRVRDGATNWWDYVGIDVKFVADEFIEPKSNYQVSFFAEIDEGLDVLAERGDIDGVWILIEFDDPQLLDEGRYAFLPEVHITELSAALPDLYALEEPKTFEETNFKPDDFVLHRKFDLSTSDGKMNTMNVYLMEAERMYGFGKMNEMQEYIEEVFTINEHSATAHILLAGKHAYEGNTSSACDSLDQAWSIVKNNLDIYIDEVERPQILQYLYKHIGLCYHRLGEYENAELFYLASIEMLEDPVFSPGPEVDDHWRSEQAHIYRYLDRARKTEELDEP